VLVAKTHKVEMMNAPRSAEGVERGDEYCITARGYRNLTAAADQGGDGDVAKLYDSGERKTQVCRKQRGLTPLLTPAGSRRWPR